ncbi:MAG: TIGR02444 family protein [Gammaproteobacteria bacterium]
MFLVPSDQVSKAFWEFSVDLFTREGVEANCLLLQDRYGLNVNLTLLCLWAGLSGRPALKSTDITSAIAASAHWHGSVVEPLRQIRRVVQAVGKIGDSDLSGIRRSLLHDELAAERIEQSAIVSALPGIESTTLGLDARLTNTLNSLSAYLLSTHIQLDTPGRRALYAIIHSVFDEIPRNKLARMANRIISEPVP